MSIVVIISWRGEINMKNLNYHLYLTDDEYSQVIHSLIGLKNNLIQAGKYTDVVDDLLVRLISAKKKNIKIEKSDSKEKYSCKDKMKTAGQWHVFW